MTTSSQTAGAARPNFLLIMTDQQNVRHLGAYGNRVLSTPHIDALAAQGLVLDRFYVNSPVCMPNRAALATGRMPTAAGVRMNGVPLPLQARTHADFLREAGYRTALIGKAHFQTMTDHEPAALPGQGQRPWEWQATRDERSGAAYAQESPRSWQDPNFEVRTPYYGFDTVRLCLEHADEVGGDFARWLQRVHGLGPDKRRPKPGDSPAGNAPQSWPSDLQETQYPTHYIAEESMAWIDRHVQQHPAGQPFFLQCSFPDPHHPFSPPGRYWSAYRPADVDLPESFHLSLDAAPPHKQALHAELAQGLRQTRGSRVIAVSEAEARHAIALNYGAVQMIDDQVGRLLAHLRQRQLLDNTVVIFMSDHGDFMGEHGLLFKGPLHYDSLIRSPLIWKDPQASAVGLRSQALVSAIDLLPTLLERAGIAPPHGLHGRSFWPAVLGQAHEGAASVLVEEEGHRPVPGLPAPPKVRTLVTPRHRLSVYPGASWAELYDLVNDPMEARNLFHEPSCASLTSDMLWQLVAQMGDLADNLPLPRRMA